MSEYLTIPQARGRLVATLLREYERRDMIVILWRLGYSQVIEPSDTDRALAHRIAWRLLPAALDRNGTHSNLSADLSVLRQRL